MHAKANTITCDASRTTDEKGTVLCDGLKAGKDEFERGKDDAEAMLRSIMLVPRPLPK
jgi:hypothetical protein